MADIKYYDVILKPVVTEKSMNAMANSFSISKEVADSLSATTSLAGGFTATKAMADSLHGRFSPDTVRFPG